ncbi:hypothetical protein [Hymenobacter persicinus]|uniref:Uncharacterized protein n=1 Tax=Hymenobacter persicinus TaxID=2025506 RepID=A0A4Q5LCZ9_9BACT|nr:hypothetical protein [Hymenobacter persicinus]RYU79567.1 hypothetical protein EWM57_10395 [Hymenobacter persicinus]
MAHNPNDGSNDNPDEFSEFRKDKDATTGNAKAENHREGEKRADAPLTPTPSGTPAYGDFGHDPNTRSTTTDQPAGMNPGGVAAPSTAAPEQRGSAPQNLNPDAVRATQNASEEERREAYKQDDPRYGGGTRNWESEEPANRTRNSAEDPNDNLLS